MVGFGFSVLGKMPFNLEKDPSDSQLIVRVVKSSHSKLFGKFERGFGKFEKFLGKYLLSLFAKTIDV